MCAIEWQDTHILLHNTNMAYRFVSFPMTLGDLYGHSTNIYATFRTVSTDTVRRAVPRR